MGRRGCDADVRVQNEPPRKRTKSAVDCNVGDESLTDDAELPCGLILKDVKQNKWKIGRPIGRGSFGRIYLASNILTKEATIDNSKYVVKIEPHDNGPLFVELNCLVRNCRGHMIRKWKDKKKLKSVGVPQYISHGSHNVKDIRYRFLVLPRYDKDLMSIIQEKGNVLDLRSVLVLAYQILHVLEYIHERGYTHSDIKSSNLMVGFDGVTLNKPNPSTIKRLLCTKDKAKLNRPKIKCNYYKDEDFEVQEYEMYSSDDEFGHRSIGKMLKDPKVRRMHRNHAFNLRQLQTSVNYEDVDSSICSDLSYQAFSESSHQHKHKIQVYNNMVDEGFHEDISKSSSENSEDSDYSEAVLSQSKCQIYLLDYGLASKFLDANGVHKEFGMDQRKAHDGTLKYSSLDSHIGAHSRRSDLESLGYNLLDWLSGSLPWKNQEMLAEPDLVHALKKNYMQDIKGLLTVCFKSESYPQFLETYFAYIKGLEFSQCPDYKYCRDLFKTEFVKNEFGAEKDMVLVFDEPAAVKKNYSKKLGRARTDFVIRNGVKKARGRENKTLCIENDLKLELLKKTLNLSNDGFRKPCSSRNFFISDADLVAKLKQSLLPIETPSKKFSPKKLRSQKPLPRKRKGAKGRRSNIGKFGNFLGSGKQFTWAEILAGNPEEILRKERRNDDEERDSFNSKTRNRKASNASESCPENAQSPLCQKNYLSGLNPTYAMKEVYTNFRKKTTGKKVDAPEENCNYDGYTPAMIAILKAMKSKRGKNRDQADKPNFISKIVKRKRVISRSAQAVKKNIELVDKNVSVGRREPRSKRTPKQDSDERTIDTKTTKNKATDNAKQKGLDTVVSSTAVTRGSKRISRYNLNDKNKNEPAKNTSTTIPAVKKESQTAKPAKIQTKAAVSSIIRTRTSTKGRSTRSGLQYSRAVL